LYISKCLKRFALVTTRESSSVGFVETVVNRRPSVVVDPTMLLNIGVYNTLISNDASGKRYIFAYFLDEWSFGDFENQCVHAVSKAIGVTTIKSDRQYTGSWILNALGITNKLPVVEWLTAMSFADYVVTNSFHGTVFAILYHKKFITTLLPPLHSDMDCRLVTLLEKLGLTDRIVRYGDSRSVTDIVNNDIDWHRVDKILESERKRTDELISSVGL